MKTVVEGIPTLMHIAVFLFFAGLVDFLLAINIFVAHSTLGIVVVTAWLYIFITFLPVIRRDSPYKTPLSGICWRLMQFLGLLQYVDRFGDRRSIEGSMEQGREVLAAQDPGRDERDRKALFWTVESLTDNVELEPFVEGIPSFLSDLHQASIMRTLVLDKDVALLQRIYKALMTCKEPGTIAEDRRRRRAIACMHAISSLARVVDTVDGNVFVWINKTIFQLKMFEKDKIFGSCAVATLGILLPKLQKDIINVIRAEIKQSRDLKYLLNQTGRAVHNTTNVAEGTLALALQTMHDMDLMDSIVELIPTAVNLEIPPEFRRDQMPFTKTLLSRCQSLYIPQLLLSCKDPTTMDPVRRQRRVLACLKASNAMASFGSYHSTIIRALPTLTKDASLDIVHHVNCTTARLACHLQSDIVDAIWKSSNLPVLDPQGNMPITVSKDSYRSMAGLCGKLDALDILCALPDDSFKADLERSLMLRVVADGYNSDDHPTTVFNIFPDQYCIALFSLESMGHKEKLGPKNGQLSRFPVALKILLNQGHLAILVSFLHFISVSPPPSRASLDPILQTIQFIEQNATVRWASHSIQASLVSMTGKCATKLHMDLVQRNPSNPPDLDRIGHVRNILDILFGIIGTVSDSAVAQDAAAIVRAHVALDPLCKGATTALRLVSAFTPY